jgi:hypothetical protein
VLEENEPSHLQTAREEVAGGAVSGAGLLLRCRLDPSQALSRCAATGRTATSARADASASPLGPVSTSISVAMEKRGCSGFLSKSSSASCLFQ